MTKKPLKSWKTLASESKARRKTPLTPAQVEKLNTIFDEIEKEQEQINKDQTTTELNQRSCMQSLAYKDKHSDFNILQAF